MFSVEQTPGSSGSVALKTVKTLESGVVNFVDFAYNAIFVRSRKADEWPAPVLSKQLGTDSSKRDELC
jgi:hypothetical protein